MANKQPDIYITPCGHRHMSEEYFDKCLDWWFTPIADRPPIPTPITESHFNIEIAKNGPLSKEIYDNKKEKRMNKVFEKLMQM